MPIRQTNRFALALFIEFIILGNILGIFFYYTPMSYALTSAISQCVCFIPPIVLYFVVTKKSPKEVLRLKKLDTINVLLLIGLGIFFIPILNVLAAFSAMFFPNVVADSLSTVANSHILIAVFAIGCVPALFEELIFRGILQSGYRSMGPLKAALCSALLFALLHMNPQQAFYAFFIAVVFSFLVERTDSIFSAIIPHFIINAINVASLYIPYDEAELAADAVLSNTEIMAGAVYLLLMSAPMFLLFFITFLKRNPRQMLPASDAPFVLFEDPEMVSEHDDNEKEMPKDRFITLSIILVFIIFILLGLLPYLPK